MEAAEALRPWGDVPVDILVHISAFLPCLADRVYMAAVNGHWRNALRPPPPELPPQFPPELPWLIFPSTEEPTFYNPIADRYQVLCFNNGDLEYDIRRARCCGSGDGGWLVLELDLPHAYALYNLNSGDTIPLPPLEEFDLHAAAIWPNNPAPPYVVAAIVRDGGESHAAFWRLGGAIWSTPVGMPMVELQDLVQHENSFFFLTSNEDVIRFWFHLDPNGNATQLHRQEFDIGRRPDYRRDVALMHNVGRIKRYIVVSEGGILMVLRYAYRYARGTATDSIRVFQLHDPPEINGFEARQVWMDDQLAGRMLFLGLGCSRILEVDHYPYDGFEESMVYFLEERMGYITLADGRRQYRFTDMGRYSMGTRTRVPWPPGHPGISDNARPTWWLH